MLTFIMEMLGMNQLLNSFIITIPSLSAHQRNVSHGTKYVSNVATSSSTTDGGQIISKNPLLSTSDIS